jgi:chondroitin 4-sulfotransferase 11
MVLHDYKLIFIHIPKNAGVSIYEVFEVPQNDQGHKKIDEYDIENVDEYFKFCFVRNPWDRFVSTYSYFKKGGRGRPGDIKDSEVVNSYENFNDFVNNIQELKESFNDRHFYNQSYWLDDSLDFIGRFESLQEDFNTVCDMIDIPHTQLPHKNKSKHKHYTEYYDEESKQIVADIYANDIECFDYKFGE